MLSTAHFLFLFANPKVYWKEHTSVKTMNKILALLNSVRKGTRADFVCVMIRLSEGKGESFHQRQTSFCPIWPPGTRYLSSWSLWQLVLPAHSHVCTLLGFAFCGSQWFTIVPFLWILMNLSDWTDDAHSNPSMVWLLYHLFSNTCSSHCSFLKGVTQSRT